MPKFIQFFQSMDKDKTNKEDDHEMKEVEHEGINYDYLHPNFTNE